MWGWALGGGMVVGGLLLLVLLSLMEMGARADEAIDRLMADAGPDAPENSEDE